MHTGNQLKIIKLESEKASQLEFLKTHVRDFYTKKIIDWQYRNEEYNTGLFFVENENKLIASQGMMPIFLSIAGKKVITAKSESSFLLPEFRGRGIFEDLYFHTIEAAERDGIQMIWGFTALSNVWRNKLKFEVYDRIVLEAELQMGFRRGLAASWRIRQPLTAKLKGTIKSMVASARSKKIPIYKTGYSAEVMDLKNTMQLNMVEDLYEAWRIRNPDLISILCSKDYICWRIVNNPVVQYKCIGIFKNKVLVGLGIVNDTQNKAYLVDFIVPDKMDLADCFNSLLFRLKENHGISHLIFWASHLNGYGNSIHSLFKLYGAFIYENTSMNFVLKRSEEAYSKTKVEAFYINGLWTEGFTI